MSNEDVLKGFEKLAKGLDKFENNESIFADEMEQRIKLAKTDEEARTIARVEAIKNHEPFDESKTPKEELNQAQELIVEELVKQKIDSLFNGF